MVVCRVPRVDCYDHGVRHVSVPWAGPKSRFTLLFERLAIEQLQVARCQSRTAKILRLSPGQVHDRFHIAIKLGDAVDRTRRSEVKSRPELKNSR
jgi:transposase